MEFNSEQQAHIDKLIAKKFAEAMNKAEARVAEQLAAAETRHAEETKSLKVELEKYKTKEAENTEKTRRAELTAQIAQLNAIDATQVAKLIGDSVTTGENGELRIVDDKGVVRLDEAGNPLSVKTFLEGFLKDNPHLVKASGSPGAGSSGGFYGPGTGAANTMRRAAFDKLPSAQRTNLIQAGVRLTD